MFRRSIFYAALLLCGSVVAAAAAQQAPAAHPWHQVATADTPFAWSGLYFGVQAGGAWSTAHIIDSISLDHDLTASGGFGGLNASWLQQRGRVVFGIEGEFNYGDISSTTAIQAGNNFRTEVDWFGSVAGKAGFAHSRWLVAGLAGIAFANGSTGQTTPSNTFDMSSTYTGWTVGATVDYAVNDKVTIGAKYQYYDFGSRTFAPPVPFTSRTQSITMQALLAHIKIKLK